MIRTFNKVVTEFMEDVHKTTPGHQRLLFAQDIMHKSIYLQERTRVPYLLYAESFASPERPPQDTAQPEPDQLNVQQLLGNGLFLLERSEWEEIYSSLDDDNKQTFLQYLQTLYKIYRKISENDDVETQMRTIGTTSAYLKIKVLLARMDADMLFSFLVDREKLNAVCKDIADIPMARELFETLGELIRRISSDPERLKSMLLQNPQVIARIATTSAVATGGNGLDPASIMKLLR